MEGTTHNACPEEYRCCGNCEELRCMQVQYAVWDLFCMAEKNEEIGERPKAPMPWEYCHRWKRRVRS